MSEQGPIRTTAELIDGDKAVRAGGQDGTETELERFGLGPEDQDSRDDDGAELLSGADATQERDSSLNRFGLGPEE